MRRKSVEILWIAGRMWLFCVAVGYGLGVVFWVYGVLRQERGLERLGGMGWRNWLWSEPIMVLVICFGVMGFLLVGVGARRRWEWRRLERREKGLCMECGYDIRVSLERKSGRCSECGGVIDFLSYRVK